MKLTSEKHLKALVCDKSFICDEMFSAAASCENVEFFSIAEYFS